MSAKYQCRCCWHFTLPEPSPGSLEICPVCFWQDDAVGAAEPTVAVGSNAVSLLQARLNYKRCGACESRFADAVRAPRADEKHP
jgi:Cysteine-rich CPCC